MNKLKTTNILLLIIVIPIVFYIMKTLSFIFIPLILSMFIAQIFLPIMRWFRKKRVSKPLSIFFVILIIAVVLRIGSALVLYSSNELLSIDNNYMELASTKINKLIYNVEYRLGIDHIEGGSVLVHYFNKLNLSEYFGDTIDFLASTISTTLLTAFFLVLWLYESINFQKVLNKTILKRNFSSIKVFVKIENELITFMKVKFIISLFTGIGITLICLLFDVSFPVFWGLFAFVINFVQMVGSIISVVLLALFAFIELDPSSSFLFFVLSVTAVQVVMGGILEPIFMGKSFAINIITILVMLSLWGFIWGIPGLIMAIPLTVFLKIILEQFESTKVLGHLISGTEFNPSKKSFFR